mmetsp:Transcript_28789/g.85159  ORF Transcript_28789/g.85159 Transcript_28789/m.85159 type:complete len:343 (-) Transcript_28789:359-1387(-)
MAQAAVRALVLPRSGAGAAQVWAARVEHPIRVQHVGRGVQHDDAAHVPHGAGADPMASARVRHRTDQLWRPRHRRQRPPLPAVNPAPVCDAARARQRVPHDPERYVLCAARRRPGFVPRLRGGPASDRGARGLWHARQRQHLVPAAGDAAADRHGAVDPATRRERRGRQKPRRRRRGAVGGAGGVAGVGACARGRRAWAVRPYRCWAAQQPERGAWPGDGPVQPSDGCDDVEPQGAAKGDPRPRRHVCRAGGHVPLDAQQPGAGAVGQARLPLTQATGVVGGRLPWTRRLHAALADRGPAEVLLAAGLLLPAGLHDGRAANACAQVRAADRRTHVCVQRDAV